MSSRLKILLIFAITLLVVCFCVLVWTVLGSSRGIVGPSVSQVMRPLNNGVLIPVLGLGTWRMNDTMASKAIIEAIDIGYKHIDTAWRYQNEKGVGRGLNHLLSTNQIRRYDVFVTSKVWNTYHSRSLAVQSIKESLHNLGLDYLDLALIHWPTGFKAGTGDMYPKYRNGSLIPSDHSILETWRGMEDAYRAGLAKSIGVSNFNMRQIEKLIRQASIKPMVNQVEIHPFLSQRSLVEYCQSQNIAVTAYSPLRQGDRELLNHPVLNRIANKYKKTAPQVALRWLIQRNIIAIPKTVRKDRMKENIDIFDFELTDLDMDDIYSLNSDKRLVWIPGTQSHPDYPFEPTFQPV